MKKTIISIIMLGLLLSSSAQPGRYRASMYPETTAVLQVIYSDFVETSLKYTEFAIRANKDGASRAEGLFAALAVSNSILADTFETLLKDFDIEVTPPEKTDFALDSTKHNLELAANVGLGKIDKRFSVFLDMIQPESNMEAISNVKDAWELKKQHLELIKETIDSMGLLGFVSKSVDEFYVCKVCGSITTDPPTFKCPVCDADADAYEEVTAKWQVYLYINGNNNLNKEEKGYARRTFDSQYTNAGSVSFLDRSILSTPAYKKWGLGDLNDFTDAQKAYIAGISRMADLWDSYSSIDLNDLSDEEKDYIDKMHEKYGQGPIDLSERRNAGAFSQTMEELLGEVELLSGESVLYDVDIVFIKRTLASN